MWHQTARLGRRFGSIGLRTPYRPSIAPPSWTPLTRTPAFPTQCIQHEARETSLLFSTAAATKKKSNKRSWSKRKNKKIKNQADQNQWDVTEKSAHQPITVGENGRLILTNEMLDSGNVTKFSNKIRVNTRNSLNLMNNLQKKLLFAQRTSHKRVDSFHRGESVAEAIIHTTFFEGELPNAPADARLVKSSDGRNMIELCNTARSTSKKKALTLAAVDFLWQLQTECGVNVHKPIRQPLHVDSFGDNGRLVLTNEMLENEEIKRFSSKHKVNTRNSVNLMNNVKHKMLFAQHMSHKEVGPLHRGDSAFQAILHTTFYEGELPKVPADARLVETPDGPDMIQLCNTARSTSKKKALSLAAMDFLWQLQVECDVNVRNAPNTRQMRAEAKKQRFKDMVAQARSLLGVVADRKPLLTTNPLDMQSFQTVLYLTLRNGQKLNAVGPPGKSKAEAEGLAYIEATGEPLQQLLGLDKLRSLEKNIEASPAKHLAALKVPALPQSTQTLLQEALGTPDEQQKRRGELQARQTKFEERFAARMAESWQAKFKKEEDQLINSGEGEEARKMNWMKKIQKYMEQEESERLETAAKDPESAQGQMLAIRENLPIKAIRDELLQALQTDQVVVVSGGTGSGKSTQCPQYILEDAIARKAGAETRIIVTQPRRIAAISVAERVADERGETLGKSVGYRVRHNSVSAREAGCIEFVTTGVLLRRLVQDRTLKGVSHVMIDEVHERDINTDFLLVLLRELVAKRPDLRVVLMSATLDAKSFSNYFARGTTKQVPLMSVPAKPRHPVKIIHLEDVGDEESYSPELRRLAQALLTEHDQQVQRDLEEAEAEERAALELEEDENSDDYSDFDDIELGTRRASSVRLDGLREYVAMRQASGQLVGGKRGATQREIDDITVSLVAKVAAHVAKTEIDKGWTGSVLCFLPGWDEIKGAMGKLEECDPELYNKLIVIPLHSTIPKEEQHKIFEPAPDGMIKVIFATNIAESSVTINDALAIVDSGLVRELNWDAESAMSTMCTVPTSKASATQRTGRAGRVAPGTCYRLYSRGTLHAMPERPTPEIKRAGLENTCLQTCNMTRDGVQQFLRNAMDPPPQDNVVFALERLEKIGAIRDGESGEVLTPLGSLLSRLPLDPAMGRMLVFGCVMQCLDPVLTAAACFSSRDPFYSPPGMREEARATRKSFCGTSDLMATLRAYNEFIEKQSTGDWQYVREWSEENFISRAAMSNLSSVKSQLLHELVRLGLVDKSDLKDNIRRKNVLSENAFVNQHADNEGLFVAIWATGLPGNLAARRPLGHFGSFATRSEQNAGLHPSSVAFYRKPPDREERQNLPKWFIYHEMVLSSQVFVRNCTAITPEQIMLFGGLSLSQTSEESSEASVCLLDDWMVVESSSYATIDLLTNVRDEIESAVALKVMRPREPLPSTYQRTIDAVAKTLDTSDDDQRERQEDETWMY